VLFNSYYQGVGERHPRPERGMLSRPDLAAVLDYRAHVDHAMEQCCALAAADPALARMIELGINHEEQHQELILADILHLLSRNPGRPAYDPAGPRPVASPGGALQWISHPAGIARIGHVGTGFAFDNEGPAHRVYLEAFEIAKRPVTNGDYLAFIDDGGYRRPELWLALGWEAVCAGGWAAPLYWEWRDAGWESFTLRGMAELDLALPVLHLSYFEADAYARWAQARLPTEFEWEAAMRGAGVAGEVWEWTSSAYAAYPGFRPAAGVVGEYNGKFMCNQYVLRGASFATPPGHARISYRNFFPPDARWQFTGLRLARDCRGA
jgi:ergothioneine biosynthesis protein EgtB